MMILTKFGSKKNSNFFSKKICPQKVAMATPQTPPGQKVAIATCGHGPPQTPPATFATRDPKRGPGAGEDLQRRQLAFKGH